MRRAASVCILLAALIGYAALLYDLYGPTYSTATCDLNICHNNTASLIQAGLTPTALVFILLLVLFFTLSLLAAFLLYINHQAAKSLLAACLFFLLAATVISGFSIGFSFLPSDLLLVAALILATRRSPAAPS